jgi:hypothetical protein
MKMADPAVSVVPTFSQSGCHHSSCKKQPFGFNDSNGLKPAYTHIRLAVLHNRVLGVI